MACKDYEGLLMGFLDHELSPEETTEVNDHMQRCQSCRQSYDELAKTAEVLDAVAFAEPGDEVLKDIWKSPIDRAERAVGFFLIFGGYLALISYALYETLINDKGPIFPRVAGVAVVAGFVVLLLSVAREQLRKRSKDPYKEVER